jgi:CHASE3 domain sensor protein
MRVDLSSRLHSVNLPEFGVSALIAAVVMFVAAMAMLNQNVTQLRRSFGWVEQVYAVQKRIDAVNNRLSGVELTVRGFALTGDPAFLRRYRNTHGYLIAAMRELHDLTAADTALQADYAELERAVALHEALYGSLIGQGPQHQAVVAEAITNPAKRQFNGRAIQALNRMEATEQRLWAKRQADAERDARTTYAIALGIAGLAFLTGSLGFALTLFGRRHSPLAVRAESSP